MDFPRLPDTPRRHRQPEPLVRKSASEAAAHPTPRFSADICMDMRGVDPISIPPTHNDEARAQGPWFYLLTGTLYIATTAHILFGTILLASLLFISLIDAITIVGRYVLSALLCRVVVEFELLGMSREYKNLVEESAFYRRARHGPVIELDVRIPNSGRGGSAPEDQRVGERSAPQPQGGSSLGPEISAVQLPPPQYRGPRRRGAGPSGNGRGGPGAHGDGCNTPLLYKYRASRPTRGSKPVRGH